MQLCLLENFVFFLFAVDLYNYKKMIYLSQVFFKGHKNESSDLTYIMP